MVFRPAEQLATGLLALVGDPPGDDALDLEPGRIRVAAGGERLVLRAQKALLGEPALGPCQHHVGRDHPVVIVAPGQREDRSDARIGQPLARRVARSASGRPAVSWPLLRCVMPRISENLSACSPAWETARRSGPPARWCRSPPRTRPCSRDRRLGLRIPGVDVRHPAPEEDLDHRLGLGLDLELGIGLARDLRRPGLGREATGRQPVGRQQPAAPWMPRRIASRRECRSRLVVSIVLMVSSSSSSHPGGREAGRTAGSSKPAGDQ